MTSIAVLGMGAMGSRMAINYAKAGHDVTIWNRTTDIARDLGDTHGLVVAETPAAAVAGVEVAVGMVADDVAADEVWRAPDVGALAAMASGATVIESSTLSPDLVRSLATSAAAAGVDFVEAPVVGSRPQAEAGALFYLIGGAADQIERVLPIIEVNAGALRHVGPSGVAAITKLAINGLFAAQVVAYGEALGFLERCGVAIDEGAELLAGLPITSPGLQRILGLMESRTFEPNFPIRLVAKDLGYLVSTGRTVGAELPVASAVDAVFGAAASTGERDHDIAGVVARFLS